MIPDDRQEESLECVLSNQDVREFRSAAPRHAFQFDNRMIGKNANALEWVDESIDKIEATLLPHHEHIRQKAIELFQKGKTLYFSDVARYLEISLREAVELCEELISEKKIYVHKSK